jgi:L-ascorbate metabolism protein UlaG (beta-lactamase superfamily)
MKLTKYEHACLLFEDADKSLLVDPGIFSKSVPELSNVVGIVITHAHPDHFDIERLRSLIKTNPSAQVFTVQSIADEVSDICTPQVVTRGMVAKCDPFELNFYGGQHAEIHTSIPVIDNIGVMVNQTVYYPGDSFALPDIGVPVLAVPASAPWMRIGEALNFIEDIKPKRVFPTHNALLSDIGTKIHYGLFENFVDHMGSEFEVIEPGKSIDLS